MVLDGSGDGGMVHESDVILQRQIQPSFNSESGGSCSRDKEKELLRRWLCDVGGEEIGEHLAREGEDGEVEDGEGEGGDEGWMSKVCF